MNDSEALSRLAEAVEQMAKSLVEKMGGYRPFGGVVDAQGKPELIFDQASVGVGDAQHSLERLMATLREEARSGKWDAVGVANMAQVRQIDGSQRLAIVISMHHRLGRCIDYVTTFERSASGAVTFDTGQAGLGRLQFFEN